MTDNKVHPEEGQDETVPLKTKDEAAVRACARLRRVTSLSLGTGTAAHARALMYPVPRRGARTTG